MSYTFITQYDSPNYTPAADTRSVYGRDRTIEAIAIHWWGDPATNPTLEGVVATLTNPARQASAHFVATGTGRRVACLVAPEDTSWATNNANPYSISIECDPRCRDEDYDVVGELVAELRATYGNLPLVPHKQFYVTRCPGNYDLNRINSVAATKIADKNAQFGQVVSAVAPTAPAVVVVTSDQVAQAYRDILEREADPSGLQHYTKSGMTLAAIRQDLLNSEEYKQLQLRKAAIQQAAIDAAKKADEKAKAEQTAKEAAAEAKRIADEKATQQAAIKLAEEQKAAAQTAEDEKNKNFIIFIINTIINYFSSLIKK